LTRPSRPSTARYTAAKRLIDEADAADPNQPATINLRGEILLAQKDFDGAENAFKQRRRSIRSSARRNTPGADPVQEKDYTKARDRFGRSSTARLAGGDKKPGGPDHQVQDFLLTLLLEGKDSRAQKMMEQFQSLATRRRSTTRKPRGSSNRTKRESQRLDSCRRRKFIAGAKHGVCRFVL